MLTYKVNKDKDLRGHYRNYVYSSVHIYNTVYTMKESFNFNSFLENVVIPWEEFKKLKSHTYTSKHNRKIKIVNDTR